MLKRHVLLAICVVPAAGVIVETSRAAADQSWPAEVSASYKLYFNGFDVGGYRFESRFNGKSYDATSNAKVSALFGAFTWKGTIEAAGAAEGARPKPAGYKLTFRSKSKQGAVTLGFNPGGVSSVALEPDKPPNPEAVPLAAEHYKNVLDPMAAILAISRGGAKTACDKRIPIFDGKARFDLQMSFKGEEKIADKDSSGQPKVLIVCAVKYVPIAGHKPKDFQDPWVDYNSIEIALRPVPSANLVVPYRVTVPTTIGAAVMMAESVNITTANHAQIALKQQAQ